MKWETNGILISPRMLLATSRAGRRNKEQRKAKFLKIGKKMESAVENLNIPVSWVSDEIPSQLAQP